MKSSIRHNKVYNQLLDLDKANERLGKFQKEFDAFIGEISRSLAKTVLGTGELGAFLLHRHWKLEANCVMVERPRVLQSGKVALITKSLNVKEARMLKAAPCRWMVSGKGKQPVPLEYSVDPFVQEVHEVLIEAPKILKTISSDIVRHGLQDLIGFMIIPRRSLSFRNTGELVETNRDNISIVTVEHLSPKEKLSSIMTGWPFSSTRNGSVWACCYCSHGGGHSCRHPKPDPPICRPHGCV